MARRGRPVARGAVDRLELRPTDHVIEIGFGPRVGLELISNAVAEGWVAGVDPSDTMHRQAARCNADAIHIGRMTLVKGTID